MTYRSKGIERLRTRLGGMSVIFSFGLASLTFGYSGCHSPNRIWMQKGMTEQEMAYAAEYDSFQRTAQDDEFIRGMTGKDPDQLTDRQKAEVIESLRSVYSAMNIQDIHH